MMMTFLVLVYVESSSASSPVNTMTIIIFLLTSLVMVRQGVLSRDDALLRARHAADVVEARYASLIKNATDVIMITGVDGQLQFASPAAERTFSIHPDDLVGRNLLDFWADGDRERLTAFLAEVAATRDRVVGPAELVVETGDRRSTLECVGSNLTDDPAIAGLALNFRDVSERKVLEEQLRKLAFHDPLTLLANRSLFRPLAGLRWYHLPVVLRGAASAALRPWRHFRAARNPYPRRNCSGRAPACAPDPSLPR